MDKEEEVPVQKIRSLITGSQDHNRHTCDCEGCKWYWLSTAPEIGYEYVRERDIAPIDSHHSLIISLKINTLMKGPPYHKIYIGRNPIIRRGA